MWWFEKCLANHSTTAYKERSSSWVWLCAVILCKSFLFSSPVPEWKRWFRGITSFILVQRRSKIFSSSNYTMHSFLSAFRTLQTLGPSGLCRTEYCGMGSWNSWMVVARMTVWKGQTLATSVWSMDHCLQFGPTAMSFP